MGLSSKKTTSKTTPYDPASVKAGTTALTNTYNANAPKVQGIADSLTGMLPGMQEKYGAGDAGINAARNYNVDVLGGKYLDQGNPYLEQMVSQTNNNVSNTLGASLNKMGLGPAGTTYQGLQARELGKAELGMRYGDYNAERDRMANAAGQSPSIAAGDVIGIAPMLATAQLGANLPMDNARGYAQGIGGLVSPYNTTTQKQSGGLLGDLLGAGLSGWASGGFG